MKCAWDILFLKYHSEFPIHPFADIDISKKGRGNFLLWLNDFLRRTKHKNLHFNVILENRKRRTDSFYLISYQMLKNENMV